MKRWFVVWCCALLGACSTVAPPPSADTQALFDDSLFAAPSVPLSADAVLALSPAMREVLRTEIAPVLHGSDPRRALVQALVRNGRLHLDYDAQSTRTAAQAFEARAGNCLSLVIMTAAFAREAGLPVRFQKVLVDDAWARSDGLVFAIGHINLALGRPAGRPYADMLGSEWIVVDFYPGQDIQRQRIDVVSEARVLALYMNNKAAEALAAGQVDDAYGWARAAVVQDPTLSSSLNLLGVVYARRGHWPQAQRALQQALRLEPDNLHAMGNQVGALHQLGREPEALALAAELKRRQPVVPFAAFDQGLALLRAGQYQAAETLFVKELGVTAQYHEVHFWLAVAQFNLGERASALQHLKTALDNSTTRQQQAVYAAKLEHLKALGVR